MRYKAFGASRSTSGTTPTIFRYTGQREEAGLGLYYYGARWYDPALGHFIRGPSGRDTLVPDAGNALDYHRYGYARFNALKYTDPSGHQVECPEQYQAKCGNGGGAMGAPPSGGGGRIGGPGPNHGGGGSWNSFTRPFRAAGNWVKSWFGGGEEAISEEPAVTSTQAKVVATPAPEQSAVDQSYLLRLPQRRGNRGPTTGILVVDGQEYDVVSGKDGPAANIPAGTPGFDALVREHAEGHAAARMHELGRNLVHCISTIARDHAPHALRILMQLCPQARHCEWSTVMFFTEQSKNDFLG